MSSFRNGNGNGNGRGDGDGSSVTGLVDTTDFRYAQSGCREYIMR